MSKGKTIFVAILLILSAAIIHFYVNDENAKVDKELIEFFSGFIFGIGVVALIVALFKRKKV
jgi:hypothetical protein